LKRLTDTQKAEIRTLRASGLGYGTIAEQLSLSRNTVRSFCSRNNVPVEVNNNADDAHMAKKGMKFGNTVFIITTAHSESASETLVKKLEKLILDDAAKQSGSYQFVQAS